jgi:hypothetical protein
VGSTAFLVAVQYKSIFLLPRIEPRFFGHPARNVVTLLTDVYVFVEARIFIAFNVPELEARHNNPDI